MGETNTKSIIVDAFIEKVSSGSLRNVHVAKLIKELNINRNTFYYHFDSKYDVALYVYRTDLARWLRVAFAEEELVLLPMDNRRKAELEPYFVHCEVGAHTLEMGEFCKVLIKCLLERPSFYSALFDPTQQEFRMCFEGLYRPAIANDLKFVLGGRYLPPCVFDYFVDFNTRYLYQVAEYFLRHTSAAPEMLDEKVNPFWNMPYESLSHALQTHTVQRPHDHRW